MTEKMVEDICETKFDENRFSCAPQQAVITKSVVFQTTLTDTCLPATLKITRPVSPKFDRASVLSTEIFSLALDRLSLSSKRRKIYAL